jgi:hypothetical protein
MPVSQKQLEANQKNAQKSTGPLTEEGKKISSQNAVTHGLNATRIVLNSPKLKENQSEYDTLVAALIEELQPASPLQTHLVYKIANCHWRYNRLINAESAAINLQTTPDSHLSEPKSSFLKEMQALETAQQNDPNWAHARSIPLDESADILSRYENRLNRELHNSYKLLRQLQAGQSYPQIKNRQNEPIFAKPAVVQEDKNSAPQPDLVAEPASAQNPDSNRLSDPLSELFDDNFPSPNGHHRKTTPIDNFLWAIKSKHDLLNHTK